MNNISKLAQNIIGSEIIKIAAEANALKAKGQDIANLTIGDFDPKIFPIPLELEEYIAEAYANGETNYPPADGLYALRRSVQQMISRFGLDYDPEEILIAAGARPIIYTIFKAIVDPGDKVIYSTPSWNNNHYTYLSNAVPVEIPTKPENDFMPTAEEIEPHIKDAILLALCSPQNPTGTMFTKEGLSAICKLVIQENHRRLEINQRPLMVMFDQIYCELLYGGRHHENPVSLYPEMRYYTIFVDGVSKSLSATGVRVGWAMGPKEVIAKMKSILTHIGAWAPKAEQEAVGRYMWNIKSYERFIAKQKRELHLRLSRFYKGFMELKGEGFKVDAIEPQAAIYLTVQLSLHGQKTADGKLLVTTEDVTSYVLNEAKIALVPFYAFGSSKDSDWYRLSVGTCRAEYIKNTIDNLRKALEKLQ